MKIRLSFQEVYDLLGIPSPEFPKYVSQLINLASGNAQATRPRVVGQMTELIKEFRGKQLDDWAEWYAARRPDAIETATEKILQMLDNLRNALDLIDADTVREWVTDLVVVKTFIGLKVQEAILKRLAQELHKSYRLSDPNEEARGIDGFVGEQPVSIKPYTYDAKRALPEQLEGVLVYYSKTKRGFEVRFDPDDFV